MARGARLRRTPASSQSGAPSAASGRDERVLRTHRPMMASRSAAYSSVMPSRLQVGARERQRVAGVDGTTGERSLHRRVALAPSRTRVHGATVEQIEDTDHSHVLATSLSAAASACHPAAG